MTLFIPLLWVLYHCQQEYILFNDPSNWIQITHEHLLVYKQQYKLKEIKIKIILNFKKSAFAPIFVNFNYDKLRW